MTLLITIINTPEEQTLRMQATQNPELMLEQTIVSSASDDHLSQKEKKHIVRWMDSVDISPNELTDYAFYVAEQIHTTQSKRVANWLRDFVLFAQRANAPWSEHQDAVWFSPGTRIREIILNSIRYADESIHVAVYNFTDHGIAKKLAAAIDRGLAVTIVTTNNWNANISSRIPHLRNKGAHVLVTPKNRMKLMHHKYAIFDQRFVLTGSYN